VYFMTRACRDPLCENKNSMSNVDFHLPAKSCRMDPPAQQPAGRWAVANGSCAAASRRCPWEGRGRLSVEGVSVPLGSWAVGQVGRRGRGRSSVGGVSVAWGSWVGPTPAQQPAGLLRDNWDSKLPLGSGQWLLRSSQRAFCATIGILSCRWAVAPCCAACPTAARTPQPCFL
jgi:hypothetical protein